MEGSMAKRFILSIDGGGIRGIIPAAILVNPPRGWTGCRFTRRST